MRGGMCRMSYLSLDYRITLTLNEVICGRPDLIMLQRICRMIVGQYTIGFLYGDLSGEWVNVPIW